MLLLLYITVRYGTVHHPAVALMSVGDIVWRLERGSHSMRSASDAGEPTLIFSNAVEKDPEAFYCVIFKRGG